LSARGKTKNGGNSGDDEGKATHGLIESLSAFTPTATARKADVPGAAGDRQPILGRNVRFP
jgi:hypothetical protein